MRSETQWVERGASETEKAQSIVNHAKQFAESGTEISYKGLRETGQVGFLAAVYRYYPGGVPALRQALGESIDDYQRPRNYWSDPEVLEREAKRFYEEHGQFSANALKAAGAEALMGGILRHYPGRLHQLKENLGLNTSNRKPRDYWSPETIEQEAQAFYLQKGRLTQQLLEENGHSGLSARINSIYPGGIRALREKLGVYDAKGKKSWTQANILAEAKRFFDAHGKLSRVLMLQTGESGLASAVTRKYPGGWIQLRRDLGLTQEKRSSEHSEVSEKEAQEANWDLERLLEVNI